MDTKQFFKQFGEDYKKVVEYSMNFGYDVNEAQFNKLNEIVKFLQREDFEIENLDINPALIHGGVTAYTYVMHFFDKSLKEFIDVLENASAVSFDADKKGRVCISITVADVFKRL